MHACGIDLALDSQLHLSQLVLFSVQLHTHNILSVCPLACLLSVCLFVYLRSHICSDWAQIVALNLQRYADADTAAAQLRQQAECAGGEEARSMVQQLVGHVVTQKDRGRQSAAKVRLIMILIMIMIIILTLVLITISITVMMMMMMMMMTKMIMSMVMTVIIQIIIMMATLVTI